MKKFFEKYPVDLEESVAIKMIHKTIESAEEKCKHEDPSYVEDLSKAYAMLEDFFREADINPAQYFE